MATRPTIAAMDGSGPLEPLETQFQRYRDRLHAMIAMRIDRRIRHRVDPSDILQEAFLDANKRVSEYHASGQRSPYLWLRYLTFQRLLVTHRQHLQVKCRDAAREIPLEQFSPSVSGEGLLELLIQSGKTPSAIVAQAEETERLRQTLDSMEVADREILALRHFEQVSNAEAAQILGITPDAAKQRFHRALKRLSSIILPPPSAESPHG